MKEQLTKEELDAAMSRKERDDKGKRHRASSHGGFRVGQYNLAGRLERVFNSLMDAVDNNDVGATYQGILYCIQGKIRKHSNKIWKKEE